MTQQLLAILSLVIVALAGTGLLLAFALRLVWSPLDAPVEQRATAAKGWKTLIVTNMVCLALATATWLLADHFSAAIVGRCWLASFLIFGPLAKILRRFKSNNVPTP